MILFQVESVKYRNKEIDRGVILRRASERLYSSMLDNQGVKISAGTQHKNRFDQIEYLPICQVEENQILTYRRSLSGEKYAEIQELKVIEFSKHHVKCEILTESKELKRTKKAPENTLTACYFEEEPLNPETAKKRPEKAEKRPQKSGLFGSEAGKRLSDEQIKFCIEFGVFDRKNSVLIEINGKTYQRKTDYFYIYAPAEKARNGSIYKKIVPERWNDREMVFEYSGRIFDELTGIEQGKETGKLSPRYKEIDK